MPAETVIHPTAVVEAGAQLGAGVSIGPFAHIGGDAVLGDGVEIGSHSSVTGATTLGANCKVASHAALGGAPQNVRHGGGRTTLTIGANTVIREFVSMNTGSDSSRGETSVGANGFFLAYCHVGHDCVVGDNAVFANGATLGGHCEVGDNVGIGGLTAVHQFVRIGEGAFIAGCTAISGDVGPYAIARGNPARLRGLNVVGLRRSGLAAADVRALRMLYRTLFDRASPADDNLAKAGELYGGTEKGRRIIDFYAVRGKRQLTVPPVGAGGEDADDDG